MMTDPVNHLAFFNSERIAWFTSVMDRKPAAPGGPPEREPHSRYSTQGYRSFRDPDGYPATAPPWATLTAVDLNTGKVIWHIPFGEYPELAAQGLKGLWKRKLWRRRRDGKRHNDDRLRGRRQPFQSL